jgi:8-oxo-dGTP diphosphatase
MLGVALTGDPDDVRAPHLRRDDFLGAFGVLTRAQRILFVQNRRVIGGREELVWDLPGGQVERGETLAEALARELREEIGVAITGEPRFLFFQEGERVVGGARPYVWRSFFFAVEACAGEPRACDEVLDLRWMSRAEMQRELTAPYHASFVEWLEKGGAQFGCVWRDV